MVSLNKKCILECYGEVQTRKNLLIDIIFAMNFFSNEPFRAAPWRLMSVLHKDVLFHWSIFSPCYGALWYRSRQRLHYWARKLTNFYSCKQTYTFPNLLPYPFPYVSNSVKELLGRIFMSFPYTPLDAIEHAPGLEDTATPYFKLN